MTGINKEYLRSDDGNIYPKPFRPTTIGEGRRLITEVFERNRWDERSVRKYFEMHDVAAETIAELTAADIRTVIDSLEKARMVIFKD